MRVTTAKKKLPLGEEAPLTRATMTDPFAVQILGAILVKQLIEYGHCTFAIEGEDEGVHLIEPWRVAIDGASTPLPPHALLDALPEEEAIDRMVQMGMTEGEMVNALQERDRRLKHGGT